VRRRLTELIGLSRLVDACLLHGARRLWQPIIAAAMVLAAPASSLCEPTGISPAQLAGLLDQNSKVPLVLDARGREAHREGTVPGAVHVGTNPAGFLPPASEMPVVLVLPEPYDPAYSQEWAGRLEDAGLSVRWLEGGLPAWRAAGFSLASPEHAYRKPGTVPFIVPRGLCEMEEPAHEFK
jgi:rhodanese-related sulfurtransferase